MLLHLHGFHVKGDSRPPSQSPMRVGIFTSQPTQCASECECAEGAARTVFQNGNAVLA